MSLTPRSARLLRRSAISATRVSSAWRSAWRSASASISSPSGELPAPVRAGVSYSRMNATNTAGTASACLRTQTGAMSPSGCIGLAGVSGDRGEWARASPLAAAGALRGGSCTRGSTSSTRNCRRSLGARYTRGARWYGRSVARRSASSVANSASGVDAPLRSGVDGALVGLEPEAPGDAAAGGGEPAGDGEEPGGPGGGGSVPRPATNMSGWGCARNWGGGVSGAAGPERTSSGYEFMVVASLCSVVCLLVWGRRDCSKIVRRTGRGGGHGHRHCPVPSMPACPVRPGGRRPCLASQQPGGGSVMRACMAWRQISEFPRPSTRPEPGAASTGDRPTDDCRSFCSLPSPRTRLRRRH